MRLFVNHTVVEFGEFAGIPSVGRAHEIAGDTLDRLELGAAFRACVNIFVGILISAVRAVVAIVVHRSVPEVVLVHHVDDLHDRLFVMCGVTVYLHIEYMSARGERMIWSLNLGLVSR